MHGKTCEKWVVADVNGETLEYRCGQEAVALVIPVDGEKWTWAACGQHLTRLVGLRVDRYESPVPPGFPLRIEFLGTTFPTMADGAAQIARVAAARAAGVPLAQYGGAQ